MMSSLFTSIDGQYFVRLRSSGFATSIMFPVPPGCMIQNIGCPNPGFFTSMSLLNPGSCKQPRKSLHGGMYFAEMTVTQISGSWLNNTGGVLPDSNTQKGEAQMSTTEKVPMVIRADWVKGPPQGAWTYNDY